jgi:hypothetical protein
MAQLFKDFKLLIGFLPENSVKTNNKKYIKIQGLKRNKILLKEEVLNKMNIRKRKQKECNFITFSMKRDTKKS